MYFGCLRKDGLTSKEIDEIAELNILRKTDLEIDFEVDDALRKLEALQIVYAKGDHWFCVTIEKSVGQLGLQVGQCLFVPLAKNVNSTRTIHSRDD